MNRRRERNQARDSIPELGNGELRTERTRSYDAHLLWDGQLGMVTRRMAEAGVDIEVHYSDHDHRLVPVVDRVDAGRTVSEAWGRGRSG